MKYYTEYAQPNWIDEKLEEERIFPIMGVFQVGKEVLHKKVKTDQYVPEYYFKIGSINNDYFLIDKTIFGLKNEFYFHKDIDLSEKHFLAKSRISLLKHIDQLVSGPIYIGGDKEEVLPYSVYEKLIKVFPNDHEIKLYRHAKVTSILGEYFEHIDDKESSYQEYINKKTPTYKSNLIKTFKQAEIHKYETLWEHLKNMLNGEIKYSENQWQTEILEFILLLFPKYITVFEEVRFKDVYSGKTRKLDYGLIDYMGHLDVFEIKIPFDKNIVSDGTYRDNHIPRRDLSGTIMQIEKYIYYLNKGGVPCENRLSKKYKDRLPEGLQIKITNPSGMIIMGRDENMSESQLADFEIIKRKYKNIIDIFTYDDLLRRLEVTIHQLKKI